MKCNSQYFPCRKIKLYSIPFKLTFSLFLIEFSVILILKTTDQLDWLCLSVLKVILVHFY